uniref:Fibrinogen C-terminal domain-containing protein n=1 Tax=Macrostomum lignano TaxID=282301 RepID=A0A1I8IYX3_9PLAT
MGVSGQVSQCAPAASSLRLRFVAQLNVNGCALFVHDTGASDGPHLAVEPLMCVTRSLKSLSPKVDLITQQMYVSIPVLMTDDGMLAEAQRQLQHLSPKSVTFAAVSEVNASTDANSTVRSIAFIWSPHESVGDLRIETDMDRSAYELSSELQLSSVESLQRIRLSAKLFLNGTYQTYQYRVSTQNHSFFDPSEYRLRYCPLPSCRQLRFIRSISLENCSVRVHQRLDIKGHFLIEPLLCHNISSLSSESIRYDFSRGKYYLKLNLLVQDEASLQTVRTKLADFSPLSVEFMRLWTAERSVSSSLSARFEVGPLMVSANWRSAQLRLYCSSLNQCGAASLLRSKIVSFETFRSLPDGRWFVTIQQRVSGSVSFQRTWAEYETGFGHDTDFWIGGATLRVEMRLWNGSELHAEYAGFQVGDASSRYRMTYREMLPERSTVSWDAMEHNNRSRFSTMDADNDRRSESCSDGYGKGGWWFNNCMHFNPNGIFSTRETSDDAYMSWFSRRRWLALRQVRLLLQI